MSTIRIHARRYEDEDDCLSACEADIRQRARLQEWDLNPRWEDEQREAILLDVPASALGLLSEEGAPRT